MLSLSTSSASSSSTSLHSTLSSRNRALPALPSPTPSASSASSSASSSRVSLTAADDENATITAGRFSLKGKQRSQEDLHSLAVSSRITELSYSISDIETRIFEIQELRHKSQSGDASSTSRVIDQSLAQLDERLQFVQEGVAALAEALGPALAVLKAPPPHRKDEAGEDEATLLRKHAAMLAEWEAVQKESQILREELREDKWLTVFRTVTEQADGMMTSLEKAVNRCQDFIDKVRRHGLDDSLSRSSSSVSSLNSQSSPLSFEAFTTLSESFEAKKKHYMPATTKVLSIIDKGVQERVTKNGECLRRHAESTQRWNSLKDRISRTDKDMDVVRKMFAQADAIPSGSESGTSGATHQSKNGYLTTPPNGIQASKSKGGYSTISRSISPFRKLARKIKGSKSPVPATPALPKLDLPSPSPESATRTLRHRSSLFNMLGSSPLTPERPGHKHSQSLTPDSSPSRAAEVANNLTLKLNRPKWNSSTRVPDDERSKTVRPGQQRRPSNGGSSRVSDDHSPFGSVTNTPYKRSVSRSSMASSRPWSPVTSSNSTAQSSLNQPLASLYRPPSRAHTPGLPLGVSPRARPQTPSHIPRPSLSGNLHGRSVSGSISPSLSASSGWDEEGSSSLLQRAFSPTRSQTPSNHPPRPPSRSMIPVPSVQVQASSRPSSAMSNYRPDSAMSFRTSAMRAHTPDALRTALRASAATPRLPPSSFRDASMPRTPSTGRPPSRSGAATPAPEGRPAHVYVPGNPRDPLDAEVAAVANALAHGLLIERVDPPLRGAPREGEELRAQYAFSNALARKVVNCKLTTLSRPGRDYVTKKVMCRVGGGWQDLAVYIANRQAGM